MVRNKYVVFLEPMTFIKTCVMWPKKTGLAKQSEYIDRNNKVAIFTHL